MPWTQENWTAGALRRINFFGMNEKRPEGGVEVELAMVYCAWGMELKKQGKIPDAIEKFEKAVEYHATSVDGQKAQQEAYKLRRRLTGDQSG